MPGRRPREISTHLIKHVKQYLGRNTLCPRNLSSLIVPKQLGISDANIPLAKKQDETIAKLIRMHDIYPQTKLAARMAARRKEYLNQSPRLKQIFIYSGAHSQ
ncbi:unnamed protein product, partial [Iphiclides podalirius]